MEFNPRKPITKFSTYSACLGAPWLGIAFFKIPKPERNNIYVAGEEVEDKLLTRPQWKKKAE
jgi:hypothetical protein